MKLYKYLTAIAGVGLFALTSCSEDLDVKPVVAEEDYVTLSLQIPDFQIEEIGSRAGDNPTISNVALYAYSLNGSAPLTVNLSGNQVTFKKVEGATRYDFVANYTPAGNTAPSSIFTNDPTKDYLWGTVPASSIPGNPNVPMLRHNAMVVVENSATGFTYSGFNVFGTASEGSLAPADANVTSGTVTAPTIKNGEAYGFNMTGTNPKNEFVTTGVQIFESAAGKGKIIIEGTYNGVKGYYPLAFATRSGSGNSEIPGAYNYTTIPVLRNHKYSVKIEYVRAEGWATPAQAYAAEPDNRLTALITDENIGISDIIASRDYALGVTASEISINGALTSFTFDAVTNYDSGNTAPTATLQGNSAWVTKVEVNATGASTNTQISSGNNGGNGKTYPVVLTLQANTGTEARTAVIVVKAGELKREVTIIQDPQDFIRDPNRKVSLFIPKIQSAAVTTDYFTWIDQKGSDYCFGVRPEDNQGAIRNMGLIFPPVPLYGSNDEMYYSIQKVSGDQNPTVTGDFKVVESNDQWKITQTNYSPGISNNGKLTIQNGDNTVVYVLYTTGFFHKLDQTMISNYTINDVNVLDYPVKEGWYYYEMMMKDRQYVLDRNIGATTNAPYISSYIGYRDNLAAKGAYFKVATQRAPSTNDGANEKFWQKRNQSTTTVISGLGLNYANGTSNLHIPTKGDLAALNVTLNRPSSITTGNSSYVASISGTGLVKDSRVYIPHTGYYEGSDIKLSTRANLWTSTLYSEPQGFHPNYNTYKNNNYGFWYYYLDAQPKANYTNVFNQIRCNDATQTNFSDANVTRFMPIRLVWGEPIIALETTK